MENIEIVSKIVAGHRLLRESSFSFMSRFEDGTVIPHQVMIGLKDRDVFLDVPVRGQPWALSTNSNKQPALDIS